MNEKKVREAIYCMKSFADDTVCEECDNYDRCDYNTMVMDNARTAIEALEKQLPKEAVKRSLVKDNGIVVGPVGRCPCCNEIIDDTMTVCDCGQKIDWSE